MPLFCRLRPCHELMSIIYHPSFEQALGQARTAEVQRDARIGEAESQMQAGIEEAKAEMQRMEAR